MFSKYNLLSIVKRYGPSAPLKFAELEKRLKMDSRKIALRIRMLMLMGEPVCYLRGGYFYAKEYKEAKQTIEALEYKAAIMLKAASAMKQKFQNSGQFKLF